MLTNVAQFYTKAFKVALNHQICYENSRTIEYVVYPVVFKF